MDSELVLAKLESLHRCLERVEAQHIHSLEDLQGSLDKRYCGAEPGAGSPAVRGHSSPSSF